MAEKETLRIAAVADIHVKKTAQGALQPLFANVTQVADLLLLCGDLTDYGAVDEAKILAKDITSYLRIPALGVLGNHDFEAGKQDEITKILNDAGVTILNGDAIEIQGVGFAGVRGEEIIKKFVHETIEEALKLESALARLRTPQKIAVLHYSPIQATVLGEPPEITAFLGSTRLEEPIDRYRVSTVFHGHAHHGTLEGRTKGNAVVYNVAMPLLKIKFPDQQPFRLVEIPIAQPVST